MGEEVVFPMELARFRIDTVNKTGVVGRKQEPGLRIDRDGRNRTMDIVVDPDRAGLRDIAGAGRIDAREPPDPGPCSGSCPIATYTRPL